jgi:hypothetical protein
MFDDKQTQSHDETKLILVRLLECIDIQSCPCLRQILNPHPDKRSSAAHAVQCAFLSPAAEQQLALSSPHHPLTYKSPGCFNGH